MFTLKLNARKLNARTYVIPNWEEHFVNHFLTNHVCTEFM